MTKAAKESDVQLKKLAPINPALLIERGSVGGRVDPRVERRLRNARIEERNWITLDKGELDAREKEEAAFGIHDPTVDPNMTEAEYLLEKAERSERAGQPRLASTLSRMPSTRMDPGKAPPARPSVDLDSVENDRPSTAGNGLGPQSERLGKDLDLRSLLAPGKANSLVPQDRSAASWRDIFGGGESKRSDSELALRQDDAPGTSPESLRAAGAPGAISAPISAAPESLKFRTDLGARRTDPLGSSSLVQPDRGLNPLAPPASSRSSLTPLLPPSAPRAPVVDFSRPHSASGASIQDPFNRGQGGLGPALPSAPSTPAYGQPGSYSPSTPRSGSGFNTIPTRPGFGR